MSIGKTIRLFLADGTPGGLLTAEIMSWTGRSANGRNEWVTQDGSLTYGDWQRQGVDDALKETVV